MSETITKVILYLFIYLLVSFFLDRVANKKGKSSDNNQQDVHWNKLFSVIYFIGSAVVLFVDIMLLADSHTRDNIDIWIVLTMGLLWLFLFLLWIIFGFRHVTWDNKTLVDKKIFKKKQYSVEEISYFTNNRALDTMHIFFSDGRKSTVNAFMDNYAELENWLRFNKVKYLPASAPKKKKIYGSLTEIIVGLISAPVCLGFIIGFSLSKTDSRIIGIVIFLSCFIFSVLNIIINAGNYILVYDKKLRKVFCFFWKKDILLNQILYYREKETISDWNDIIIYYKEDNERVKNIRIKGNSTNLFYINSILNQCKRRK